MDTAERVCRREPAASVPASDGRRIHHGLWIESGGLLRRKIGTQAGQSSAVGLTIAPRFSGVCRPALAGPTTPARVRMMRITAFRSDEALRLHLRPPHGSSSYDGATWPQRGWTDSFRFLEIRRIESSSGPVAQSARCTRPGVRPGRRFSGRRKSKARLRRLLVSAGARVALRGSAAPPDYGVEATRPGGGLTSFLPCCPILQA